MQETDFLSKIGQPAKRALQNINVSHLSDLTKYTEKELLALHGVGKKAVAIMNEAMKEAGLHLNNNNSGS